MIQSNPTEKSHSSGIFFSKNLLVLEKIVYVYKFWHKIAKNFPKTSRFTLGQRIDHLFLGLLEFSFSASYLSKEKKLPLLKKITINLDLLKFFLKIAWEMEAVDSKKYENISVNLAEIGRMVFSWKNQVEKNISGQAGD